MTKNSRLKVLHIIASVNRVGGGPIQALLQTLEALKFEQEIETISLDTPDSPWVKDFPGVVHAMGPTFKKYGYTARLSQWIEENGYRFDVAVIHGLWNHASVGGWQGCMKAKLPYVLFTHGMMGPWFKKAHPLKHCLKQLFWLLQGRALRDASEVLFTCEEEKRLAEGAFWGFTYTPKVVAFGAADAVPLDPTENEAFNAILPNINNQPYLLYLSRIHKIKGCDLLLKGFAQALKRTELQLVIAGPGDDALINYLKESTQVLGISDRVHWPGMLKGAAKAAAFRGAEAFILTSHHENFGIAVAEALAYGKPVLISNQINIWREIEAGGAGIVAPDTVEGATHVIQTWESMTPEQRIEMGQAARSVYEANFTVEAAAKDLTAALLRAVQNDERVKS